MDIKIKRVENGKLPEYKTDGAAGADCYARISEQVFLLPGRSVTIPLGFAVEIPEGYEMQIRGRSGNAKKHCVDCFIGTIDSDYRGEVAAILINKGEHWFEINPFDRVAQAVIAPVVKAKWQQVQELSETKRGEGGFGSTGISENKEVEASYPHKVEKFYEPFKTYSEVESCLGKEVVVDGEISANVKSVFRTDNNFIVVKFLTKSGNELDMYLVNAFERVKIDGHRFGRELEVENN